LLAVITSLSDYFYYLCEGDSGAGSRVGATVGVAAEAAAGMSVRATEEASVRMRATANATAVP